MATTSQPVVYMTPTSPIALSIEQGGVVLNMVTGGSAGAVTSVNGETGAVTISGLVNPMTTLGDTMYGGTGGAVQRLAGNSSNIDEVLVSLGNGTSALAPQWVALTALLGSAAFQSSSAFDAAGSAATAQSNAEAYAASIQPLWFTNKSGVYVQGQASLGTSSTLGNGSLRLSPLIVAQSFSIAAIGAEFTVAGDANSIFHIGIFGDDGTCYPGALLLDAGSISTGTGNAGTVATGGTPGVYLITLGTPLAIAPGIYWLGGAVQGVTTTQPTIRTALFGTQFSGAQNGVPGAGAGENGYSQASVTGAMPSSFAVFASSSSAGSIPRIVFKIH